MGIRVLGPVGIDGAERLSPRDRAVLGALVVERAAIVSPERIAEALWGEALPASWRKVVQSSIVRLRQKLGPQAIETTSSGYRLTLGADEVDAWSYEQLLDHAHTLAELGEVERAGYTLDQALALWHGEPLVDLDGWAPAAAEAIRLQELHRLGEERRADTLLAGAQHERLIPIARSLIAAEPLRERRWELLALALYRSGRQAEALRAIADARRLLRDELGIEPTTELLALEQDILDQSPSIAAPTAPRLVPTDVCPYKG
ncbi:MAG: AfsR/SARP family transcriptional regulator, partial [Acidimicrobiia bacterium]